MIFKKIYDIINKNYIWEVFTLAKDLRETWKETGIGLGHAFRDLGKTLIKTGATAMKKADNWANSDNTQETKEEKNKE